MIATHCVPSEVLQYDNLTMAPVFLLFLKQVNDIMSMSFSTVIRLNGGQTKVCKNSKYYETLIKYEGNITLRLQQCDICTKVYS